MVHDVAGVKCLDVRDGVALGRRSGPPGDFAAQGNRGYNMGMGEDGTDILAAAPIEVYKADDRSRVWRIEGGAGTALEELALTSCPDGSGGLVVKRFEYAAVQQRAQWMLGMHPAQRERAMHGSLARAGVSVAPIIAWGVEPRGLGCRAWLVQPWLGRSLHQVIRSERAATPSRRREVAAATGELMATLIRGGWFNRDMKASNIVIDGRGRAWLIDAGAVRRRRQDRAATITAWSGVRRMLLALDESAARAGASRMDRRRGLRAIMEHLRPSGNCLEELPVCRLLAAMTSWRGD